jgi:hypothetical protein
MGKLIRGLLLVCLVGVAIVPAAGAVGGRRTSAPITKCGNIKTSSGFSFKHVRVSGMSCKQAAALLKKGSPHSLGVNGRLMVMPPAQR